MDTHANDDAAAMRAETARELALLVYHPRHGSDPEAALRLCRGLLGRPDLTHAALERLTEREARTLIAALREARPDRTSDLKAKVAQDLLGRP